MVQCSYDKHNGNAYGNFKEVQLNIGTVAIGNRLLGSDRARCALEFLQHDALRKQFRKDNWLCIFPGIKHVQWDTGPAKLLQ